MKTLLLVLAGTLAIAGGSARMQEPPPGTHDHGQQTMRMMDMSERDKKLDELVARLNAAWGNDRIDALVAVVNELVAERKAMQDRMKGMMQK